MNWRLFVYGSLMNDKVLMSLLNRIPKKTKATLKSFKRSRVKNASYPAIFESKNHFVDGFILEEINEKEKKLLDLFEDEYDAIELTQNITIKQQSTTTTTTTTTTNSTIDGINQDKSVTKSIFAYVWKKENYSLLEMEKEWDYEEFIFNRLENFLKSSVEWKNSIIEKI